MELVKKVASKVRGKLRPPNTDPLRVLHRDEIYAEGPPVDAVLDELLDFVVANSGHHVLDIGCGVGPYVAALNQRGFHAEGIELDDGCVRQAQAMNRPVHKMDATKLAYATDSFDTCVLIEVVEHLTQYEKALREAGRVARRCLIISVPNVDSMGILMPYQVIPRHLLEPTHVNFFGQANMRALLTRLFPKARIVVEGYSAFFPPVSEVTLQYQLRALVEFAGEEMPVPTFVPRGEEIRGPVPEDAIPIPVSPES